MKETRGGLDCNFPANIMRSSSSPFPSNQSTPKTSLPMELQFQQHHQIPVSRPPLKSKNKTKSSSSSSKFVGVRQRPSGRWVAEIKDTTKKIRMWLGTFESPEEAARAYDAAACLLRGSNTRTNFASAPDDSPLASRIRNLLNLKKQKNKNAIFNPPPSSTSPINSTPAATLTGANTSSSRSIEPAAGFRHESQQQEPRASQMDEEVCRPCFGDGGGEELEFWNSLPSSLLDYIEAPPKVQSAGAAEEISEFERMKVERQLSASLYAFNGVQEYLDTVYDPSDALWDLPPLCHLSCRT